MVGNFQLQIGLKNLSRNPRSFRFYSVHIYFFLFFLLFRAINTLTDKVSGMEKRLQENSEIMKSLLETKEEVIHLRQIIESGKSSLTASKLPLELTVSKPIICEI